MDKLNKEVRYKHTFTIKEKTTYSKEVLEFLNGFELKINKL